MRNVNVYNICEYILILHAFYHVLNTKTEQNDMKEFVNKRIHKIDLEEKRTKTILPSPDYTITKIQGFALTMIHNIANRSQQKPIG